MPRYRVIDCRTNVVSSSEIIVTAQTPEHAARLAIGEELVRNGGRGDLRVRVYSRTDAGTLTMGRLFVRAEGR